MAITNQDRPTYAGLTWTSILTTWASELKAWGETDQSFAGIDKPVTPILNLYTDFGFLWSLGSRPWEKALPWQNVAGNIININKPS